MLGIIFEGDENVCYLGLCCDELISIDDSFIIIRLSSNIFFYKQIEIDGYYHFI